MRMKCPHCGVSGRADASLSGKKVKCPKCSRFFLIPVVGSVEELVEDVETKIDEPLAPGDSIAPVIEDEPEIVARPEQDEPAASDQEDVADAGLAEQEGESAEIEEWTEDSPESPVVAEDIELDAGTEEGTEGDPGEEVFPYDSGDETEPMAEELESEPELTEEPDPDEQEYELDFPEEDPAEELQEVLEENVIPEGDDSPVAETEEEFSSEVLEDPAEEQQDEGDQEDALPEDVFADQGHESVPEAADTEKDGVAIRDDEFPDLSNEGIDWEEEQGPELGDDVDEQEEIAAETAEEELRAELEAMLAGTCSACGKTVDNEESFNEDGRIICADCFSDNEKADSPETSMGAVNGSIQAAASETVHEEKTGKKIPTFSYRGEFSVIRVLKEAWVMTRGIKGAVWAGILVMMLILFGIGAAALMLPAVGAPAGGTVTAWINILIQLVSTILSMTFTAGLMYMGVRRVAGRNFSWKMIFSGFARLGQVAVAGILMTLLITSGFILLVLPGIYLAVGYSLTLPLILDKGLGPWEAMETSRRCVHRKWWPVFGAYLLMYPIYFVSCIPFGLGMIWTIPMFIALSGVLYRLLCTEEFK
jgi:uncharacterized Zn finger protein (UPF0148 family)